MRVTVIGTGYVGLVTGVCLSEHGHEVICVDKIASKIDQLRRGELPIYEPGLGELMERNVRAGRLKFTTDLPEAVRSSEVLFIAVGTPPGPNGEADLSFVRAAAAEIGESMPAYRVVVNKSTVPVGTADLVAGTLAERSPFPFDVVSNPEFLREGAAVDDCLHPDRIVVGVTTERAADTMKELYQTFDAPLVVTDPRTAEMIKYASNAFLATKISFINEIAGLCERMGADVVKVSEGMGLDPRVGSAFLKAGLGYGGSCFPKDTQALVQMARRVDYETRLVSAAIEVNSGQRARFLNRLEAIIDGGLEGRRIGVLGLAFKPQTDDVREAPAIEIIRHLVVRGATVRAHDPKASETAKRALEELEIEVGRAPASGAADRDEGRESDGPEYRSPVELCDAAEQVADGADALLLVTDWAEFASLPWAELKERMARPIVLDGRNLLDAAKMRGLGFKYAGVGRGVTDVDFGTARAEQAGGRRLAVVPGAAAVAGRGAGSGASGDGAARTAAGRPGERSGSASASEEVAAADDADE